MKYSGKTVSYRCAAESVAVMTIRRGPERRSRNGKLAADVFTTTMRPGTLFSNVDHSVDSRSGPTRLNFASVPSKVPWPINTMKNTSSRPIRALTDAIAWRTFSAVEAEAGRGVSDRTVTRAWSNFSPSIKVFESCPDHRSYCPAYSGAPAAPETISANRCWALEWRGVSSTSATAAAAIDLIADPIAGEGSTRLQEAREWRQTTTRCATSRASPRDVHPERPREGNSQGLRFRQA